MAIKISGTTVIDDGKNIGNVGVITANKFVGSGDKLIFSPTATAFSPASGSVDILPNVNISITFDQPIYAGVGSVFIRSGSGIGTVLSTVGITSSMISGQTLTIDPPSDLPVNTNIYPVLPQGVIINAVDGNNELLDNYTFKTVNQSLSSASPADGATSVALNTNITLTFVSTPIRGTGTIELRSGSVGGTIVESFDAASSGRISISGSDWILDPTSDLNPTTAYYLIIPSGAISGYVGLNLGGSTASYSFTTRALSPGDSFGGGNVICISGSTAWIVSPYSAEVGKVIGNRADANTAAQQVSGCTGWFVPTQAQLQNPGYLCRSFWGGYSSANYWSSSQVNTNVAYGTDFTNGANFPNSPFYDSNNSTRCVRSFRCVPI